MMRKLLQSTLVQMFAGITLLAFLLIFLWRPILWAYNGGSWAHFRAPFSSFYWVLGIEWPYAPVGTTITGDVGTKGFCAIGGVFACGILWLMVIGFCVLLGHIACGEDHETAEAKEE